MSSLQIRPAELAMVQKFLASYVSKYDVYAFGSRVTGKARKASDLDLVVMTDKPLDFTQLSDLKEAFRESDLPFKVDIVDWAATKENFKKIILQQRLKIQAGKKPTYETGDRLLSRPRPGK